MAAGRKKIVTIFGSGHIEENFPEYQKAVTLGRLLTEGGMTLCNGGYGGIMEASARGAKQCGGKTLGIINKQASLHANRWVDKVKIEKTWRDRLFRLIETGDAFIFFDGGTGTLTELFTVWEMTNKKLLAKPILIHGTWLIHFVAGLKKQRLVQFSPWIRFVRSPAKAVQILQILFEKQGIKKD